MGNMNHMLICGINTGQYESYVDIWNQYWVNESYVDIWYQYCAV